jgi:CheY-like chemotaxis protein/HPt (histidine-containing phosphotransfer) domain-containing protein
MKRIAVVEDNPDNRLLVRVLLESLYEVTEFEDGVSALQGLRQQKPDLLLLDISLPEMDGMEVLRRLRADPDFRLLPIIALTAHAMAGDREKYLAAGFDGYVTKPIVDETVLLEAIRKNLPSEPAPSVLPPKDPPGVDASALDRLRKLGGDSFAADMLGMFLDYTGKKIAEGVQAHAAGDLTTLWKAVHPIKSSAGNVGATYLQELAARIEELARDGNRELLPELLQDLERSFTRIKPEMEATRQTLLAK